jgi:uncharacterized protein YkwD
MTALFPDAPPGALLATLIAVALSLPACGGGSDEPTAQPSAAAAPGQAPTPALAPAPPAASAPPAAPTPSATDAGCGLPELRAEALRLVNAHRAAGAVCGSRGRFASAPALAWDAALATAADGHSRDMAARNYFSHTGADGRSAAQRVTAAGYAWQSVGENIGAGYDTVQTVVDGWMASEGHCANLMTAEFRHMGLACAKAASGPYGRYWTLDLARPS